MPKFYQPALHNNHQTNQPVKPTKTPLVGAKHPASQVTINHFGVYREKRKK